MSESEMVEGAGAASAPQLSYAFARRNGVLLEDRGDGGRVAVLRTDAPAAALLELQRAFGPPASIETVSSEEFGRRLTNRYERGANGTFEAVDELGADSDLARAAEALPEPEDLMESEDDAPIIRLINAILTEAVRHNASDIHIEPFEHRLTVRMRIDGVMQETVDPPRSIAPLIISRIKVMARLDISEKRLTCACRRCPRATASGWCCGCSTSRPGASISNTSACRPGTRA